MNIGELKEILAQSDLPDHTPVLISGRYCIKDTYTKVFEVTAPNEHGQRQMQVHNPEQGTTAVVFFIEGMSA